MKLLAINLCSVLGLGSIGAGAWWWIHPGCSLMLVGAILLLLSALGILRSRT